MKIKCSNKSINAFLTHILYFNALPPKTHPYISIYKHLHSCQKCLDRVGSILEKRGMFEILYAFGHQEMGWPISHGSVKHGCMN